MSRIQLMKVRGHGGTGGSSATTLTITSTPIALTGVAAASYAGFTVSGHGGTAPYTYSVAVGTLPPPLALNSSTGAVPSATLSTNGTYGSITIRVTDAVGATATLDPFTIVVAVAPSATAPPADISPFGGDGSTPTESAVVYGTGCTQKVIAAFDEPPNMWIEATGHYITVGAAIGDRGWIAYVDFWLNGNIVRVSAPAKNSRTGGIGYCCNPISGSGADGDYTLYARVVPVNGYERLISIPITLNTNGTISRTTRYIDAVYGSNSNSGVNKYTDTIAGGGASANNTGPWLTPNKAAATAPSGSIITCAAGTYVDTRTGFTDQVVSRMIEFRLAAGLSLGDVIITKTEGRSTTYTPKATKVLYDSIQLDLAGFLSITPIANGVLVYKNCNLIDSNGAAGPATGYPTTAGFSNYMFTQTTVNTVALLETTVVNNNISGYSMARNCTFTPGADSVFLDPKQSNFSIWNTSTLQVDVFYSRQNVDTSLTVASTSYDGVHTTINWVGTPVITATSTDLANVFVTIVGQDPLTQGAVFHSQVGQVTQVNGDKTALFTPGAFAWIAQRQHADTFQINGNGSDTAPNALKNLYIQRYKAAGPFVQPLLLQAGLGSGFTGPGTITTVGTAATFSTTSGLVVDDWVHLSSGTQIGEYSRVTAIVDTTHATLEHAFTVDQSGKTWSKGKNVGGLAFVACIFEKQQVDAAVSQFQNGHQHVVFVQCSHLGANLTLKNSHASGFGLEGCAFLDSYFSSPSSASLNSSLSPFPSVGITIDNNQFSIGPAQGTNSATGVVTFDATFHPTGGLTKQVRGVVSGVVADGTPLFGWDYDGNTIVAGALIGAQQA